MRAAVFLSYDQEPMFDLSTVGPSRMSRRYHGEVERLTRILRIRRGFLDANRPKVIGSDSMTRSVALVDAVVEKCLPRSVQSIVWRDRLVTRSALVADVLLGRAPESDPAFRTRKNALHLLMTAEMTLQMLFDDLLDLAGRVPGNVRHIILDQSLSSFEACGTDRAFDQSDQAEGFWRDVLAGLATLQRWRNSLLLGAGIEAGPHSLSQKLYSVFIKTYVHVHDDFKSFEDYIRHRTNNCGMPLQSYWAAHWHGSLEGLTSRTLEEHKDEIDVLLQRYAVLGGLSNDVVGYDKDIYEGVATSVQVLGRELSGPRSERVTRAFQIVIERHNSLLDELEQELLRTDESSVRHAVLMSILRSALSIHILHESYLDVYRPESLVKIFE